MPPRLHNPSRLTSLTSSIPTTTTSSLAPATNPFLQSSQQSCQCRRTFSSTPASNTRLRGAFFRWLKGPGKAFKDPLPGSTNYLSAYDSRGELLRTSVKNLEREQKGDNKDDAAASASAPDSKLSAESKDDMFPFPRNRTFQSERVLSEELRLEIYDRVKVQGKGVRAVSVELGVDMRRVAAVIRLVDLERRMRAQNKPLAVPYARAVLSMLPTTPYSSNMTRIVPHEPINDLPMHPLTNPQIFHPIPESRPFTRTDAGRIFSAAPAITDPARRNETHPTLSFTGERVGKGDNEDFVLLPADARIPHPHLIQCQRELEQAPSAERAVIRAKYEQSLKEEQEALVAKAAARAEKIAASVKKVVPQEGRFEFRFRDVKVDRETVGLDGRGRTGVGRRYGAPNLERKRGTVKIPTRVEA